MFSLEYIIDISTAAASPLGFIQLMKNYFLFIFFYVLFSSLVKLSKTCYAFQELPFVPLERQSTKKIRAKYCFTIHLGIKVELI